MVTTWVDPDEWASRLKGTDCSVCRARRSEAWVTEHYYKIAELERSWLVLMRNQYIKGYCLLIANRHVCELHDMRPPERARFMEDMVRAGEALAKVFTPDKMNYELLGNSVPHLHAHLKPRYLGDPAPHSRISHEAGELLLTDVEYRQRVGDIREALGLIREPITDPILLRYLDDQGRVAQWPPTLGDQELVLFYLARYFEPDREYTEREINDVLKTWHTFGDWAMLRREMYDLDIFHREKDGSTYWLSSRAPQVSSNQ